MLPDVEDPNQKVTTIMLTSDLALKEDPEYRKVSLHFKDNPEEFADALQEHGLNFFIEIWVQKLDILDLKFLRKI